MWILGSSVWKTHAWRTSQMFLDKFCCKHCPILLWSLNINGETAQQFLGSLSSFPPSINVPVSQLLGRAPQLVLISWTDWFKGHPPKQLFLHFIPKRHNSAKNGAQNDYKALIHEELSYEGNCSHHSTQIELTTAQENESWVQDPLSPCWMALEGKNFISFTLSFSEPSTVSGPCWIPNMLE